MFSNVNNTTLNVKLLLVIKNNPCYYNVNIITRNVKGAMDKETRTNNKISYSYQAGECDQKTLERVLFFRNRLLVALLSKTVMQSSKSQTNNLQSGGSGRKASFQAAG